ncbi:FtsK/SpoIIIE family DNA translocase [Lachnoclostridium sp. Marseille-P6806]|uniref:FtsK/SpoIIIE family DNA translocase n=1 Tax=Lachnoclostridium sp. Marseille-P6806 TaxID=2364793 RepID=UPI00102F587A|nr:DNA translocase FtsK [Lachnoclostridium sp. Marseille-P6806]
MATGSQNNRKKNGTAGSRSGASRSRSTVSGRKTSGSRSAAGKAARQSAGSRSSRRTAGTRSASAAPRRSASAGQRGQGTFSSEGMLPREDLILIFLLAGMIFLFFANFGRMGVVGNAVSGFFFGLFGFSQYLLPVFVFVLAAFWFSNRGHEQIVRKIVCLVVLFLCFGIACELMSGALPDAVSYRAAEIYKRCSTGKSGGGVIAGSLAFALYRMLRTAGTVLIMIAVVLVCSVLLSGRSLVELLQPDYREPDERRYEVYEEEDAGDWSGEDGPESFPRAEDGSAEEDRRGRERMKEDRRHRQEEEDLAYEEMLRRREASRRERRRRQEEERFQREQEWAEQRRREEEDARRRAEELRIAEENERELARIRAEEAENERVLRKVARYSGSLTETTLTEETSEAEPVREASDAGAAGAAGAAVLAAGAAGVLAEQTTVHAAGRQPAGYFTGNDLHEITVRGADYTKITVREDLGRTGDAPSAQSFSGIGVTVPEETSPDYTSGEFADRIIRHAAEDVGVMTPADTVPENVPDTEATLSAEGESESAPSAAEELEALEQIQIERERAESKGAASSVGVSHNSPAPAGHAGASGSGALSAAAAPEVKKVRPPYILPPLTLLKEGDHARNPESDRELQETALRLQNTLKTFGVDVTIPQVSQGPAVTRYELLPAQGVKVSRIVSLQDDIKLNLAAADIRIEAPIPGKAAIGIEVPNRSIRAVALRDLLEADPYRSFRGKLAFAVGKDIGGNVIVSDIAKMPHMLIAGSTGSGKSVCINTLIMSILFRYSPENVKLIMIDPKIVELTVYNGIPHLLLPVVTDPKKASSALQWAVQEMTDRYRRFAENGVRDLKGYNGLAKEGDDLSVEYLPQIVIIVDELADLMMVSAKEVEDSICRLAQLARAAGIHLIIATQRPSVDVITGLIKANMPSRVAFAVSSGVDSRTILDMYGAEKLLGKGDMLFYPQGYPKPARVQGAFVSDREVQDVVNYIKYHNPAYVTDMGEVERKIASLQSGQDTGASGGLGEAAAGGPEIDEHFVEAGYLIIDKQKASIGMLQRVYKIGFNRAARIMDQLSDAGVVSGEEGTKARTVLMSRSDFESYIEENGI